MSRPVMRTSVGKNVSRSPDLSEPPALAGGFADRVVEFSAEGLFLSLTAFNPPANAGGSDSPVQPKVENAHSAEENQVSKTSSSCFNSEVPAFSDASS